MGIIFEEIKKCEVCKRSFNNLETHHKNGNHKDNRKKNLIKICRDCHKSIYKPIGIRKIRKYKNYSDKKTIIQIYKLRKELHQNKFKHLKFIPNDFLTKEYIKEKKMEKLQKEIKNRLKNIHIIKYS